MKCVRVTRIGDGGSFIDTLDEAEYMNIADLFDGADPGRKYEIELLELPEEKFKNLPDFIGF